MAASDVAVCNLALARAKVTGFINDLGDSGLEAEVCNVLYPQHLEQVLAAAPWPFATGRARLAVVEGEEREGWHFVYALPSDCLKARDLEPRADYRIENRYLLTNAPEAQLIYTIAEPPPTTFPPSFTDALAWSLARDLAVALGKDDEVGRLAQQNYLLALSQARAQAAEEHRRSFFPPSER